MNKGLFLLIAFTFIVLHPNLSIASESQKDKPFVWVFQNDELVSLAGNDSLNLGKIDKNGQRNYTLHIKNLSEKSFVIYNVRGSCGLGVPSWPKNPILPGETANIQIRIDPKRTGAFVRNLSLHTNESKGRTIIRVISEITP